MLIEKTLFETIDKVQIAIERLKTFEPQEGYYLAFSGGKDSIVIKELANMSGVKYDAHYSLTTIDPPELVKFIKEFHSDVKFERPKKSFLEMLEYKGFPMRQARWCCELYKENGGHGRTVITGIRKAESNKRAKRKMVESCYKDVSKRYLNVIIDWTDSDVWDFIKLKNLPYCKLYDEGWKRIGCLFCPMAVSRERKRMVELYPKYANNFIKAFERLYKNRVEKGKIWDNWESGEEMFWWWVTNKPTPKETDQINIFD